jgi:alkylation response protein AidB-like acyl-CoA dehydrogenase
MTSSIRERSEFRQTLRSALSVLSPERETRRLVNDPLGYEPSTWRRLARESGLPALIVPEACGGQGLSLAEVAIAVEEAARALLCAPLLAVVSATVVLTRCGSSDTSVQLLRGIAAGDVVVTPALDDRDVVTVAAQTRQGWKLTGRKTRVLDAQCARTFLVSARIERDLALFAVPASADQVTIEQLAVLDLTRRQACVGFEHAPAELLALDASAGLAEASEISALLAAVELVGVANRCLELAVEHARSRTQFGRPIGSFQAVQHLLADALADTEQMTAATDIVIDAAVDGTPLDELRTLVSVSKAFCSDAGPRVAETLIQVLGGIGFTWEHVAHLYLRRAKSIATLYGSAREHRARLERDLGLVAR